VLGEDFRAGTLVGSLTSPTVECEWGPQANLQGAPFSVTVDDLGSRFGCVGGSGPVDGLPVEACSDPGGLHINEGTWEMVLLGGEQVTNRQLIDLARIAIGRM
jgi:hypothetical protein